MTTRFILSVLFALFVVAGHAQIKAVTGTGDEVMLYDNGTWKYISKADSTKPVVIPTNKTSFKKSSSSGFEVKSKIVEGASVFLDPKKWSFKKSDEGESAEYNFTFLKHEIYGMIINEKIELPLTKVRELALENATKVSPDIHVVHEEYRTVNGLKVLAIEMQGTIQEMKFSYFNYYYSSPAGITQFYTYTFSNLYNEYKPDMEELLNGLVVKN